MTKRFSMKVKIEAPLDMTKKPAKAEGKRTLFLLPGELVCNWLKVTDQDSRLLLRMFVNLGFYGKISVLLLMIFMGVGG